VTFRATEVMFLVGYVTFRAGKVAFFGAQVICWAPRLNNHFVPETCGL
jgi:hypothetical protein